MSCENCAEALEIDGIEPDCFEGQCRIPRIGKNEQEILKVRNMLITLKELVDPGTILRIYGRTSMRDIETLALIEEELKNAESPQKDA